jgi:hypothetical protein
MESKMKSPTTGWILMAAALAVTAWGSTAGEHPTTQRSTTGPATRPAGAAAPLSVQLHALLPPTLGGLRKVDRKIRAHHNQPGMLWQVMSSYAVPGGGMGSVSILDHRDMEVATGKERPWAPRLRGIAIWPEDNAAEEKVSGRPARLLRRGALGSRRLIVRANERFDVVFELDPPLAEAETGEVDIEALRAAAKVFDYKKLDSLREMPADYARGQAVQPPP